MVLREDSLSAKAESFSRRIAHTTQRDFRLSVASDRGAFRATIAQTVPSYSARDYIGKRKIKTSAIHPSPKGLGFLASMDKIPLSSSMNEPCISAPHSRPTLEFIKLDRRA